MNTRHKPAPQDVVPAESDVVLELRNVSKVFHGTRVVDDVSLKVRRGQAVSIIGPSGAGKSTLLRSINFLEPATSGEILFDGARISASESAPPSKRELAALRRKVGMVFQSVNLFPHLTVLRNVSLPQQRVLGRTREEADAISTQLLQRFGVHDKAPAYPGRCSGGQQQRVAIARALALNPKVMLFDEPTSALDPELGLEVLAVMRELAQEGMTMLVVTHEMHFAEDVSDEVVFMADGKVLEHGSSRAVLRNPTEDRTRTFLRAVLDRS